MVHRHGARVVALYLKLCLEYNSGHQFKTQAKNILIIKSALWDLDAAFLLAAIL